MVYSHYSIKTCIIYSYKKPEIIHNPTLTSTTVSISKQFHLKSNLLSASKNHIHPSSQKLKKMPIKTRENILKNYIFFMNPS